MNSNDFIAFAGEDGDLLFINKHDIAYFGYRASLDITEVFVHGVSKPFNFGGDQVDEIKRELNRII